jgi:hypothetical protein
MPAPPPSLTTQSSTTSTTPLQSSFSSTPPPVATSTSSSADAQDNVPTTTSVDPPINLPITPSANNQASSDSIAPPLSPTLERTKGVPLVRLPFHPPVRFYPLSVENFERVVLKYSVISFRGSQSPKPPSLQKPHNDGGKLERCRSLRRQLNSLPRTAMMSANFRKMSSHQNPRRLPHRNQRHRPPPILLQKPVPHSPRLPLPLFHHRPLVAHNRRLLSRALALYDH